MCIILLKLHDKGTISFTIWMRKLRSREAVCPQVTQERQRVGHTDSESTLGNSMEQRGYVVGDTRTSLRSLKSSNNSSGIMGYSLTILMQKALHRSEMSKPQQDQESVVFGSLLVKRLLPFILSKNRVLSPTH